MTRIGVIFVPPMQLIDVAPVELFSMMEKAYIQANGLPQDIVDIALPNHSIKIAFISQLGPDTTAQTIPGLGLAATHTIYDSEVAPGNLDILLIPGTDPSAVLDEAILAFVRSHVADGVDLLAICTGVFVAAQAGVLNDRIATGPRGMLDRLSRAFPKVKWQDKRYVTDGNIWTCSVITNGMDMTATYISAKWPDLLANTVITLADIYIRSAEYEAPRIAFDQMTFL
ncbi:ThiJ/PfpI family protein [Boeremia exigua]|uniref:ThiJ/PfpI family protein n=1 Tax=Boeremia exigua TaxID=749465 RepID=UPI001E8CA841|nr:ThiJ/PfpI family protein [Boeremia exigua]KAH6638387.1 ThiJ/PfpI family protein [Boeremia exigua]